MSFSIFKVAGALPQVCWSGRGHDAGSSHAASLPGLRAIEPTTGMPSQILECCFIDILAASSRLTAWFCHKQVWKARLGLEARLEPSTSSSNLDVGIHAPTCGCRNRETRGEQPRVVSPKLPLGALTSLSARSLGRLCQYGAGTPLTGPHSSGSPLPDLKLREAGAGCGGHCHAQPGGGH